MANNAKNTRRCIVCKGHDDKSNMIRFCKNANGDVVIDVTKKTDCRGVWVHNSDECINKLIKKRMLNATFKKDVGDAIYGELNDKQ